MKRLKDSKTSFSEILSEDQRRKFTLVMLRDILNTADRVQELEPFVVTPDEEVKALMEKRGVEVLLEPDIGLNRALEMAIGQSIDDGFDQVLILPVDVPFVKPKNLRDILDLAFGDQCVVITPSEENGTNALLMRPPDAIDLEFGGESFPEHLDEVRSRDLNLEIYRSGRVERDLDEPENLVKIETLGKGTKTHSFLASFRDD